jgi:hypothetical protein
MPILWKIHILIQPEIGIYKPVGRTAAHTEKKFWEELVAYIPWI